MALTDKLTAIGSAIRNKTGSTDLLTLDEMPTAISNIQTGSGGVPEKLLNITGSCSGMYRGTVWSWVINDYGTQINTNDITNCNEMFYSSDIEQIPFDINLKSNTVVSLYNMFMYSKIKELPYIKGKVDTLYYAFAYCYYLRTIPDDWCNYFDLTTFNGYASSESKSSCSQLFRECYSLRNIPSNLLKNLHNVQYGSQNYLYYYGFNKCYTLDKLIGLPVYRGYTYTNNMFYYSFHNASRLKNVVFDMQDDGTPYVVQWKSQTIDLSQYVGYASSSSYILNYNSGITSDKQVTDDATYQSLKDDPDWFTTNIAYSRYNHDSAVATINSLPDTSAYLAEKGGTNTIKFKGASGSSTDGGAINTLTEEEIAVATAKGWTVTLV